MQVEDDDDVDALHERIKVAERGMLVDIVGRLAREGFTISDGRSGSAREPMQASGPIKRALVSVYDKTGLEELARGLHEAGVALVSTGSSAALIAAPASPSPRSRT